MFHCGIEVAFISFNMNKEMIQTLKILPIDKICPFEWNANSSDFLELDDIQQIRHPFLVTPISGDKYILLEESSEFYDLKQAGLTQIPVQIIQNDQFKIIQKSIGVYSFEENDLHEISSNNKNKISIELACSESDDSNSGKLYFENKKYLLKSVSNLSQGCPIAVSKLFSYFEKNGGYTILQNQVILSDSLMKVHRFVASVDLPSVSISNITDAVLQNNLFPPNILEIRSDVRILYIDFPVSTLISENLIIEKEVFLRELILLREQAEKTSTYQGKVYLLNR